MAAGQPVTLQEASGAAETFMAGRLQAAHPNAEPGIRVKDAVTYQDLSDDLYVFNMDPEGFIIMTSDRSAIPVAGYSLEGTFSGRGVPPALQMWLDSYGMQMDHLRADADRAMSIKNQSAWQRLIEGRKEELTGRSTEPLLYSTWDQGKFYNQLCPADPAGPGGHCYTGCVATAMAQILHYFMWPDSGTGSYSYHCPPYDTLSADFGNAEYRFDLMEPYLVSVNLEAAEILYHLGVSVDMVYGPEGSGMYNHKAAYSLRTFFKYLPATEYVYRDSTNLDWDSLLVAHLDQKIPLYYAGWSVPNIYGHAFVCDGYQDGNYYHFNWGWSGAYDGYFYTDNLTPGGSSFNLAQEMIVNAVPDTNTYNYPAGCNGLKTFTALAGTIDEGSGPLYDYSPGLNCDWLIAPDDSIHSINLNFQRLGIDWSDTLFIYDGGSAASPLLAALTGDEIPGPIVSTGDSIYMIFETDDSGQAGGWLATFSSEQPVYCSGVTSLEEQTDTLTDGSGSYMYHDNTACIWMIQPPGAGNVTLYFTEFATEDTFDYVSVYDLETQELLAKYSGVYSTGLPDPVTSPSGRMFVAFNTNYAIREQGWTAYYLTDLVGTRENNSSPAITIYPVPASEYINILFNKTCPPVNIILTDLTGKILIHDGNVTPSAPLKIYTGTLQPGVYILRVGTGEGLVSRKIIIQR